MYTQYWQTVGKLLLFDRRQTSPADIETVYTQYWQTVGKLLLDWLQTVPTDTSLCTRNTDALKLKFR